MLIVGAKGFAKEVLEICHQNNELENLVFYDDVNDDIGDKLYDKFLILKSLEQAEDYFAKVDNRFILGIGSPKLRKKLYDKFTQIGGVISSTISNNAIIGNYGNTIENGCNIMHFSVFTNSINIGIGVLINQLCSIGHDVFIGQFSEICPKVAISGNCKIGSYTFIGTGAIILPNVKIGNNVIIGAGSVVTKDIPDNSLAVGVPAKVVKQLEPLKI
jgi:sugar O-acyltransferase (sialic acid O-acetyltransferase NeuD family)